MTKYWIHKQSLNLLALVFVACSCSGQIKTGSPKSSISENKILPTGTLKLIKTQGSTQYDNVWCGLQDKAGNLWFGTSGEGVYRYNGKSFIQFTVKDGLNSNTVYSILEDKTGNIWLGTLEGICRFDGKKIIQIPIKGNFLTGFGTSNYYSKQSKNSSVWSMLQDKKGQIWFGTGEGVYCYDGKSFSHFLQNDRVINYQNLQLKMIDCMLEDRAGNIWFASGMPPGEEGICKYDGKSISSFKPNGDSWIRYIKEDKNGNLWFGGRLHGNFSYNGKEFSNFTKKIGIGNPILVDKNNTIWFSGEEKQSSVETVEGIWSYDGKNFKNFSPLDGMSKYFVWHMLEDRDGNIWIGTRNTGLLKYDGKKFINFSE